ncbi:MAG: hypothetical protein J0M24_11010 [Verrucomicrobia bacterium]|nr:hypothetical protein [Verrucomicrobiota bacterium]
MPSISISLFRRCASLGALIALGFYRSLAADGDLDPSFDPSNSPRPFLDLIQPQRDFVYFAHWTGSASEVRRLRADGSLDSTWSLPVSNLFIEGFTLLPTGGIAVATGSGLYVDPGDGTLTRIESLNRRNGPVRLFARNDGSVVQAANFLSEIFSDAVQDDQERMIFVGKFRQAAGEERLGLARLKRSGQIDSSWNPAPALGITNLGGTNLNVLPRLVTLGPSNSVVVSIVLNPNETPSRDLIATIDDQGKVTQSWVITNAPNLRPVVQPDGRILVGGSFTNWGGESASGLVRLLPEGQLDSSFNAHFSGIPPGSVTQMSFDDSGRILVTGIFSAVDGIARPGFARLWAYTPANSVPVVTPAVVRTRVATNEFLVLSATVGGFPPPDLQWYRDGEALPGATNRTLRWPVLSPSSLGSFQLVARNAEGTNQSPAMPVGLGIRSPQPGEFDAQFNRPLAEFARVNQLLSLPDGRILVASDSWGATMPPTVGRLLPDGTLDPTFGEGGLLRANGAAVQMCLLPDNGVFVVGKFAEFEGAPAPGLVALDARGQRLPWTFPTFDEVNFNAVARLPDGKFIVAGTFFAANGQPQLHLARLHANGTLDSSFASPLEPWQLVDDVIVDSQGRVIISGNTIYGNSPLQGTTTVGVRRLLPSGAFDPAFAPHFPGGRTLLAEPEGTVLVGYPPVRLGENGAVITRFQPVPSNSSVGLTSNRRMIRLPDGGVIYPVERGLNEPFQLLRWRADGQLDSNFRHVVPPAEIAERRGPSARALTLQPDGSVLVSTAKVATGPSSPEDLYRLRRLLPDSDLRLTDVEVRGAELHATLATQPGARYEIRPRATLTSEPLAPIYSGVGDGYLDYVTLPLEGSEKFLELLRTDLSAPE